MKLLITRKTKRIKASFHSGCSRGVFEMLFTQQFFKDFSASRVLMVHSESSHKDCLPCGLTYHHKWDTLGWMGKQCLLFPYRTALGSIKWHRLRSTFRRGRVRYGHWVWWAGHRSSLRKVSAPITSWVTWSKSSSFSVADQFIWASFSSIKWRSGTCGL